MSEDGLDFDLESPEFAAVWNQGWPRRPGPATSGGGMIGFRLASREDVDALHQSLSRLGAFPGRAPYDTFWGARYAIVEDPDGKPWGS